MKVKSESEVAQSCPTLSDPMDCSLPGTSVRGIFQTREGLPTPIFLPGEFHGQRNLAGYSPWDCKGSDTSEEKAMAPHSSTLAWKIPWMEEPGGLQSMGSLRVGHD